ncbi:hypothetical protein [Kaarinaea lacus]
MLVKKSRYSFDASGGDDIQEVLVSREAMDGRRDRRERPFDKQTAMEQILWITTNFRI